MRRGPLTKWVREARVVSQTGIMLLLVMGVLVHGRQPRLRWARRMGNKRREARAELAADSMRILNASEALAARWSWSMNLSAELSALYDLPGATTFPRIHQNEHDPALRWTHLRYHMLGPIGPVCPTRLETYGKGDGEKRACGLSAQRPPCVVISIGSNGEWEFEEDVVGRTRCTVHTFDCTVPASTAPPSSIRERVRFHRQCIGATSRNVSGVGEFLAWPALLARIGASVPPSYLKLDIEGFEFDVLGAMLATAPSLLPQQIGLEIHYKTRFRELPWFGRYKSAGEVGLFMDMLYRRGGYHLTDRNDNPFCKHCTEVVLARVSKRAESR